MTTQMTTQRYHWIGQEGQLFKRVSLVYQGLGFTPPTPDATTEGPATGAYVSNIEEQYHAKVKTIGYSEKCVEFNFVRAAPPSSENGESRED
jgi:hypothetical protein